MIDDMVLPVGEEIKNEMEKSKSADVRAAVCRVRWPLRTIGSSLLGRIMPSTNPVHYSTGDDCLMGLWRFILDFFLVLD